MAQASKSKIGVAIALLFTATIALMGTAGMAQTGVSTLVGTIRDSSGAAIPSAKVVVVDPATSFRSETTASEQGDYYVPYLSPGTYRITVEAAGFKQYVRDGVVIRTAETPRVDINMEVGALTESVNVTASAPLLATETAEAGQILNGGTVENMNIPQRRFFRMMFYFPNTISSTSGSHILGGQVRNIAYTLDGMSGKTPGTGAVDYMTSAIQTDLDAVEEVKITTNAFPASVGHSAGGAMNMVFKSGTNELHGAADDRYINNRFIQRSYLQQAPSYAPFSFHDLAGTLLGPVYLPKLYNGRNKTFFLLGWADHRETSAVVGNIASVPTQAMYNGDFSFGGIGVPIYDPSTTTLTAAGNWTRTPFPANQIPQSRFDPVAKNFLAMNPFTQPNAPGTMTRTGPVQNQIGDKPEKIYRMRWDIKLDHQFSSNDKIFGRYSQARHRADRDYRHNDIAWAAIDPAEQPIPTDNTNGVLSYTHILSPARFNELRVGYNRRAYSLDSLTYDQNWASKLGIPNVSGLTFPFFDIGDDLTSLPQERQVGEDMQLQDNFTQIIGAHNLKIGYELIRTRYDDVPQVLPSGQYEFGGTELPFTPNTGNVFASFLLGSVSSATYTQSFASWLPRWWQHALYFQDDWKPFRNLTVNIGLRWSYESPFSTKNGQQSEFNPTVVDPLTGKMGAITHPSGGLSKRDLHNFQPRLGMAWNFLPKWVFRSSFGIITADLGSNDIAQDFQEYIGTINVQQPSGDPRTAFYLSQGPPVSSYTVLSNGTVPFVGQNYSARSADWYDPNLRNPYIINWSGGVQHEFARDWLVEVLGQGQGGVGLLNSWNINQIPLNISTNPAVLTQIYQAQQNYLPYPQFGTIRGYSNFGHSTHNSGTLRVEKRYSKGLTLVTFYTYGKTLDQSDDATTVSGIDYYNRSLEKGRAGFDIRHHFVNTLSFEWPFGKGRRWLNRGGIANQILGGWNMTWVQTLESGPPGSVTFTGSPNKYLPGAGASRPIALVPISQALAPNWDIGNMFPNTAQNPYLLYNAFAYPAAFSPAGELGRNIYEGPGLNWTQLNMVKTWVLHERYKFSLRGDTSNMPFKQAQYSLPTSVYNVNSPQTFGRITSTRGQWANVGGTQPNWILSGRFEF